MNNEHWLNRCDRHWNGKVIPFVAGLNVGVLLSVIIFIVAYILTRGE